MNTIPLRPEWVEVKLSAIENNARTLKSIIGPQSELMAMVKANGYGHGAVESARAALRGGAAWLGVYAAGEGIELRNAGIDTPILVLGPTLPEWTRESIARDLTLTIPSPDYIQPVLDAAHGIGRRARVHFKIDTGMTRLGLEVDTAAQDILEAHAAGSRSGNLNIEGILTHFSVADEPNARGVERWGTRFTRDQLNKLLLVADQLESAGLKVKYVHAANSPGALDYRHPRLNLVRSGILLYGLHPSSGKPRPEGFEPALAFKTRIALVRTVPVGRFISYGATFETRRPSRIGVLMVGYADGFRRGPRNYGTVLVRGQRAPIIGRVCMDQTMVDLTDIPEALLGDEVVLIGKQGNDELSAEEVGTQIGTNNYETVTTISPRVPRIYV